MLRKMEVKDVASVVKIEESCFTSRWNEEMVLYELEENEFGRFYVYCLEGKIIGFIDFWIIFETCQLANLAVAPDYQGMGYSKEMMDEMIHIANESGCENVMLEVRISNSIAKSLYEKYNFIEMNIRKGYYSDNGEDAIIMCKPLGGSWE